MPEEEPLISDDMKANPEKKSKINLTHLDLLKLLYLICRQNPVLFKKDSLEEIPDTFMEDMEIIKHPQMEAYMLRKRPEKASKIIVNENRIVTPN